MLKNIYSRIIEILAIFKFHINLLLNFCWGGGGGGFKNL
jgi:hypothetical protein